MKLGLLTAALPTLSFDEIADWAAANWFDALEVACWPAGSGPQAGPSHLDLDRLDARAVAATLERTGLTISALAYYANHLDPDDAAREACHEHLRKVIDAAHMLRVQTVGTFIGNDKDRPPPVNLERFRELWPPLVAYARDRDVNIAIENCPMIFSYDQWPGGTNLAYSPAHWRAMFDAIPDDNFGLNLDPSHLVWQRIDAVRAVHEFGERIFHVHAKDLEVRPDGLYEHGVLSAGRGWEVPRVCGLGQVDWHRFIGALYAVGYDGVISIEQEDPGFHGEAERVKTALLIARNTLRPLIA